MAKKNINEAEKLEIKKRYTVGLVASIALLVAGAAVASISIFGFIAGFASIAAGFSMIATGIATFLFARSRKKNKLAALSKAQNNAKNNEVRQEKEEIKEIKEVKQEDKVEKQEVKKEVQKEVNKEVQEVREKNRAKEVGPNTFSVKEVDGTICKDAQNQLMIYNINDKNERDVRKIIPSLTKNELRQKTKYVISICNNDGKSKDIQISSNTFERDMNVVYSTIASVRKQLGKIEEPEIEKEQVL